MDYCNNNLLEIVIKDNSVLQKLNNKEEMYKDLINDQTIIDLFEITLRPANLHQINSIKDYNNNNIYFENNNIFEDINDNKHFIMQKKAYYASELLTSDIIVNVIINSVNQINTININEKFKDQKDTKLYNQYNNEINMDSKYKILLNTKLNFIENYIDSFKYTKRLNIVDSKIRKNTKYFNKEDLNYSLMDYLFSYLKEIYLNNCIVTKITNSEIDIKISYKEDLFSINSISLGYFYKVFSKIINSHNCLDNFYNYIINDKNKIIISSFVDLIEYDSIKSSIYELIFKYKNNFSLLEDKTNIIRLLVKEIITITDLNLKSKKFNNQFFLFCNNNYNKVLNIFELLSAVILNTDLVKYLLFEDLNLLNYFVKNIGSIFSKYYVNNIENFRIKNNIDILSNEHFSNNLEKNILNCDTEEDLIYNCLKTTEFDTMLCNEIELISNFFNKFSSVVIDLKKEEELSNKNSNNFKKYLTIIENSSEYKKRKANSDNNNLIDLRVINDEISDIFGYIVLLFNFSSKLNNSYVNLNFSKKIENK